MFNFPKDNVDAAAAFPKTQRFPTQAKETFLHILQ